MAEMAESNTLPRRSSGGVQKQHQQPQQHQQRRRRSSERSVDSSSQNSSSLRFRRFSTEDDELAALSILVNNNHTTSTRTLSNSNTSSFIQLPTTSDKSRELQRISDQVTASKLQFDSLSLYGREEEIEFIKQRCCLLDETNNSNNEKMKQKQKQKKQLILIDGVSGVGKTSLAFSLRETIRSTSSGMFSSGKFDLEMRELPYSGIIEACNDICTEIINNNENESTSSTSTSMLHAARSDLTTGLGENQLNILIKMIPSLQVILPPSGAHVRSNETARHQQQTPNDGNSAVFGSIADADAWAESDQSKSKVNYAFQSFIRTISRRFERFVIVLDDLQWADQASFAVIETLLTDRRNESNLIIFGLYRSNEVSTATHPVSVFIRDIENLNKKFNFEISKLSIGNLTVQNVHRLLQDLLSVDDDAGTMELAQLCHRRTEGNPFFLLYFIRSLKARGALQFNIVSFKWTWSIHDAEETMPTENIVDLLQEKMDQFSCSEREFLLVAACLGSSFEKSLLAMVWAEKSRDNPDLQEDYSSYLEVSLREGFLEKRGMTESYQFVHDKVQEAALSLATTDHQLKTTKFLIGTILKTQLSDDIMSKIFLIVNLLNEGSDQDESIELAQLNLKAARKASSLSAFSSAAKYSQTGIQYLPETKWRSHPKLTLILYTYAAESTSYVGSMHLMQKYVDEIISQENIDLLDKVRAYEILARQLNVSGNLSKALVLLLDLLEKLGCKFPRRKIPKAVSTMKGIFRIKRDLARISPNTILQMPKLSDQRQLAILNIAGRVVATGYLLKSDYVPIMISISTHITMQHGICKNSFAGLLFGAMILVAVFNDYKGATRIGDSLMKLLEDPYFKDRASHVYMSVYTVLHPWTHQLHGMVKPLLIGYQKSLEIGDSEAALWSGRPLRLLNEDCIIYITQAYDLKQDTIASFLQVCLDIVRKSTGETDDSMRNCLFEHAASSELSPASTTFETDSPLEAMVHQALLIRVHVLFNELDEAVDLTLKQGESFLKGQPGIPITMLSTFYSAFALICKTALPTCGAAEGRKYLRLGKKKHKLIKQWVKAGNPNVIHFDALLNAEIDAYKRKLESAERHYQKAVTVAARGGFIHDAGLASERYALFLRAQCDSGVSDDSFSSREKDALFHFDRAIDFYTSWESPKKIEKLQQMRWHKS